MILWNSEYQLSKDNGQVFGFCYFTDSNALWIPIEYIRYPDELKAKMRPIRSRNRINLK